MASACRGPAMAVPGARGKRVGEHEWVAGMLTVLSDWTEEGRKRGFNGGGGASVEQQWRPAARMAVKAGERGRPGSGKGGGGAG